MSTLKDKKKSSRKQMQNRSNNRHWVAVGKNIQERKTFTKTQMNKASGRGN